jgi:hypothetical protein
MSTKNKSKKILQEKLELPVAGSLGILANGAKAVTAWRKVRDNAKKKEEKNG